MGLGGVRIANYYIAFAGAAGMFYGAILREQRQTDDPGMDQ